MQPLLSENCSWRTCLPASNRAMHSPFSHRHFLANSFTSTHLVISNHMVSGCEHSLAHPLPFVGPLSLGSLKGTLKWGVNIGSVVWLLDELCPKNESHYVSGNLCQTCTKSLFLRFVQARLTAWDCCTCNREQRCSPHGPLPSAVYKGKKACRKNFWGGGGEKQQKTKILLCRLSFVSFFVSQSLC